MPRWSKEARDRIRVGRGTLRKHAVSRVWYFQYKDADGRWRAVTTGHSDKTGAIEWATGLSTQVTRIEQGIIEPTGKISNEEILSAASAWLDYVATQRKAGTHRTYVSCVNNLRAYLKTRPRVRRMNDFDAGEVLKYRDWLVAHPRHAEPEEDEAEDGTEPQPARRNTKKTADNNLIVLRAFFNWCVALNKMRLNPIQESRQGVQLFFGERRPPIETYTREEYALIMKHALPELSRKVRFLAASGLRIDELAHLEMNDVDLARGWLHVRTKTTHDGMVWSPKDKTDRKVPLNAELRAVVAELLPGAINVPTTPAVAASAVLAVKPTPTVPERAYLFPGRPGEHRAKNFARSTLAELKDLAGKTKIAPAKLTSHNFRRYFVSQCADCGIDMLCVMEWVGHDDWDMVRRYYRLRDEHAQAAMARFTTATPLVEQSSGTAPVAATEGHEGPRDAATRPFGESVGNPEKDRRTRRSQPPSAA
ncbi:MAG: site-specific integrase [Planctomycetota bacterium]